MTIRENYKQLFANYWLTSILISGILFLIYLFFTTVVSSLPLDTDNLVRSAVMSTLIGYQYALKEYILSIIYPTFAKISHLFQNNQYHTFSLNLQSKIHNTERFYLTMIIALTPFVILDFIKFWTWTQSSGEMPPSFNLATIGITIWKNLFDLFNDILELLIIFLMSEILWIMIELTLIIKELKEKYEVKIDIFDVDETGGLKPLRSFFLLVVSNYFIIVTLAIISYLPLIDTMLFNMRLDIILINKYEIIILILMLLICVILNITTQETIRDLFDNGVKLELERINRKYMETCDKAIEKISSSKGNNDYEEELEKLRVILDILEKEEIKIKHCQR